MEVGNSMIARQDTIKLAIDAAKKQLHDYRMCKHEELARAYKTASKIEANKAQQALIKKLQALVK